MRRGHVRDLGRPSSATKIEHTGTGLEERGYSYAADDKEITVFNNKTGAAVDRQVQDLAPKLRKVDELIPFWESDCIFSSTGRWARTRSPCRR
ncbi:MAG: hypothetical protein R2810_09245 [Flavobacteriales bacterium]